jgi:hypothetical protein
VAVVLLLVLAPVAKADDVTIDPGSPAGKEYAIPLDQARGLGAAKTGGGANGAPKSTTAPQDGLFGVGITPSRNPRVAKRITVRERARSGGVDVKQPHSRAAAEPGAGAVNGIVRREAGNERFPIVFAPLAAVGVLALGGATALFTRRRGAQT